MSFDISPTEPFDRRSAVAPQVHRVLRDAIVSLRLEPGQALSENEVAVQLGVSRTPAREAFIKLADEGLLDVFPQLGTRVARINLNAVREGQFIREVLEVAAIRSAAAQPNLESIERLEANLAEQRIAIERLDLDWFHRLDEELHRTVFEMSGHPAAWSVVLIAKTHLDRARRLSLPRKSALHLATDQHARIVDALKLGDEQAAADAAQVHARAILDLVPELARQFPHYFTGAGTRDLPIPPPEQTAEVTARSRS